MFVGWLGSVPCHEAWLICEFMRPVKWDVKEEIPSSIYVLKIQFKHFSCSLRTLFRLSKAREEKALPFFTKFCNLSSSWGVLIRVGYWIFDVSGEWIFLIIDYIFDVKDPRVSLEASTGFYLFTVLSIVFIQMFYCLSIMTGSLGFMSNGCVCCSWSSPI